MKKLAAFLAFVAMVAVATEVTAQVTVAKRGGEVVVTSDGVSMTVDANTEIVTRKGDVESTEMAFRGGKLVVTQPRTTQRALAPKTVGNETGFVPPSPTKVVRGQNVYTESTDSGAEMSVKLKMTLCEFQGLIEELIYVHSGGGNGCPNGTCCPQCSCGCNPASGCNCHCPSCGKRECPADCKCGCHRNEDENGKKVSRLPPHITDDPFLKGHGHQPPAPQYPTTSTGTQATSSSEAADFQPRIEYPEGFDPNKAK